MVCHKKRNNNFNNYISHQKPQRKWHNKFQVLKGKKKHLKSRILYATKISFRNRHEVKHLC